MRIPHHRLQKISALRIEAGNPQFGGPRRRSPGASFASPRLIDVNVNCIYVLVYAKISGSARLVCFFFLLRVA
jgi:hypothetical protein